MSTTLTHSEMETAYKNYYAVEGNNALQITLDINADAIKPIYSKPVKSKHKNTCNKTREDLFAKYDLTENDIWDYQRRYDSWYDTLMYFNGNMNMFDETWDGKGETGIAYGLNKAYEKVMGWNITKILLYIIEVKTRYIHRKKFDGYIRKVDGGLYEFCCVFIKYYCQDEVKKALSKLKKDLFNKSSESYARIIKYIQNIPEYEMLRGFLSGTSNISVREFNCCHAYI